MPNLKRGVLIALEGIDGSGKSSLCQFLIEQLQKQKLPVLGTKEPGGSALGKKLRTILQEQQEPITAKAEYLLFAADRAQHFSETIIPALKNNMLVISDRLADSSVIYQGYGRKLPLDMIQCINTWAMHDIKPDLTCYVRVDIHTAQQRLLNRGRLSTFDCESTSFFQALIDGFETLYKTRKELLIVDGTQSIETVQQQALMYLTQWMQAQDLLHA